MAASIEDDREQTGHSTAYMVKQNAQWAAGLISTLMFSPAEEYRLHESELASCKGLAFVDCTKGALGLVAAKGQGFVIRKLPAGRWSNPLFFSVAQLGLGISAGLNHIQSIMVLNSEEAIRKLCFKDKDHLTLGVDLQLTAVGGGIASQPAAGLGPSNHSSVADTAANCRVFTMSTGQLINVCIAGTEVHPADSINFALYSAKPHKEDILNGNVHPWDDQLQPLVQKLASFNTPGANQVHSTGLQHFERWRI